jgi:hypothetical protein
VLGKVEVLLGHENTLAEEVLVSLSVTIHSSCLRSFR